MDIRSTTIPHSPRASSSPNGARVAFYVGIERRDFESTSLQSMLHTAHYKPDPLNFGWPIMCTGGPIWRSMEASTNMEYARRCCSIGCRAATIRNPRAGKGANGLGRHARTTHPQGDVPRGGAALLVQW